LCCVRQNKSKTIPLQAWTALRAPENRGSQISRQSTHEGGKIVSPTHWPLLSPGNIPSTHFCQRLSRLQGHSAAEMIKSMKIFSDTIGNRTRDLRLVARCLSQTGYGVPVRWNKCVFWCMKQWNGKFTILNLSTQLKW
jgi:hypothetical protein